MNTAKPKKLETRNSGNRLRAQMDFKAIKMETRAKLKLMAANRAIPLYRLLDELVDEAFKKEEHTLVRPGVAHRFLKTVRKLLEDQA